MIVAMATSSSFTKTLMPPNRLQQDLIRKRKGLTSSSSSTVKTTPSANQLITNALSTVSKELLPSQRGSLAPTPNIVAGGINAGSVPQIGPGSGSIKDTTVTFNVNKSGGLNQGNTQPSVNSLVRHEAGHLLGATHPAIFAAGSAAGGKTSSVGEGSSAQLTNKAQLQGAVKLQGNTSLRVHRVRVRQARQDRTAPPPRTKAVRPGTTPGGGTSPIRTGLQSDNAKRRKDARALSNKMQFRLRNKGRDF